MSSVVLEGVSRRFGDVAAVDGVDLRVAEGEFVTLLGPSGCGKTTTLRMVAGLERNTSGRISLGPDVVSDPMRRVFLPSERRRLGMVFQSYAIWPHMTVFDNVAYPLKVRRAPAAEIRERVTCALGLVEMARFADRPAPALSGGQQQRVAIARALVFEPKVLLLDEPLSNLDAKLRLQMGEEFRELQQRLGVTTLYVTHDQAEAMALSDRVVVMDRGRIQQVDGPEDVYRYPANRTVAAFFGTPNLLDATVVSARPEGSRFALHVAGAAWEGACLGARPFPPGEPISVLVRPEDARLEPAASSPAESELAWHGTVARTLFRGASRSVLVDIGGGRQMNVDTPVAARWRVGDAATVVVPSGAAWAVSGQKPAPGTGT